MRFVRENSQADKAAGAPTAKVQHAWLCGTCCATYHLERRVGEGVAIIRTPLPSFEEREYFVASAV